MHITSTIACTICGGSGSPGILLDERNRFFFLFRRIQGGKSYRIRINLTHKSILGISPKWHLDRSPWNLRNTTMNHVSWVMCALLWFSFFWGNFLIWSQTIIWNFLPFWSVKKFMMVTERRKVDRITNMQKWRLIESESQLFDENRKKEWSSYIDIEVSGSMTSLS